MVVQYVTIKESKKGLLTFYLTNHLTKLTQNDCDNLLILYEYNAFHLTPEDIKKLDAETT